MAKRTGLGRGLGSLISGGAVANTGVTGKAEKKKTANKKAAKSQQKQNKPPSKKKKASPSGKSKRAPVPKGTKPLPVPRKPVEPVRENLVGLHEIPVNRVIANPRQPRREFKEESLLELAESIRSEGLLQPVVVRLQGDQYELIAGERRWRACQKLKMKLIPARVIEATESSSAVLSLIENLQREDLNPIEEAMGYASLLKDFDLTQEQVAERVGRSRASVANSLRLLQLAREIQGYTIKGHLSVGHAKVLLGVEDSENRLLLARQSIERGWSVRELERRVESFRKPNDRPKKSRSISPAELSAIEDLQKQLSGAFSTRVTLKHTPKKGKIIIEYHGNDDLQRIMEEMGLH